MQKVSVVIPTYNRANYICESIDSILAQTIKDIEIIIVDDGSTDKTSEYIRNLYGSVRYFKQDNRGVSAATNFGIKQARGEFITFLDSDDTWTTDHLSNLLRILEKHSNCAVAFSGFDFFGDELDCEDQRKSFSKSLSDVLRLCFDRIEDKTYISNENLFSVLLQKGFPFRLPGSIVRKKNLENFNICFNEKIIYSQEGVFFKKIAAYGKFLYIDQPTLNIRKHDENRFDFKYHSNMRKNMLEISKDLALFSFRTNLTFMQRYQTINTAVRDMFRLVFNS